MMSIINVKTGSGSVCFIIRHHVSVQTLFGIDELIEINFGK
jgi:hypothetical protein